jgi:multicomponent Na+:H+ antiporter subunit E
MIIIRGIVLLTAAYIALTSNLQISNILAGLLLATVVMLLLQPSIRRTTITWRFSTAGIIAFIRYVLVLIYDLIVSGIQVARIVLDPRLPIRQGNIAIPTTCETEVAQALNAHAITVTPGEMVVEMAPDGTMYTHVLDATHAEEDVIRAQEMREEMLEKIAL